MQKTKETNKIIRHRIYTNTVRSMSSQSRRATRVSLERRLMVLSRVVPFASFSAWIALNRCCRKSAWAGPVIYRCRSHRGLSRETNWLVDALVPSPPRPREDPRGYKRVRVFSSRAFISLTARPTAKTHMTLFVGNEITWKKGPKNFFRRTSGFEENQRISQNTIVLSAPRSSKRFCN